MLIAEPQGKIVKKLFRIESGEYILATFVVLLCDGKLKARLIGTEVVSETAFTGECVNCLPEVTAKTGAQFAYTPTCHDIVSPYADFSFFVSQLTRAPAHK